VLLGLLKASARGGRQ